MKVYVNASSKRAVNETLAKGLKVSGYNYSIFGGGGNYDLDENLPQGTVVAIYSKIKDGNPVAKSWGTWDGKKLK